MNGIGTWMAISNKIKRYRHNKCYHKFVLDILAKEVQYVTNNGIRLTEKFSFSALLVFKKE